MENHLEGLLDYGVTVSGSPENPILENHSGGAVIAYRLKTADENGHGPGPLNLLAFSGQPAGIPDGGSVYVHGDAPVHLAGKVHVFSGFHSVPLTGPIERPVICQRDSPVCRLR